MTKVTATRCSTFVSRLLLSLDAASALYNQSYFSDGRKAEHKDVCLTLAETKNKPPYLLTLLISGELAKELPHVPPMPLASCFSTLFAGVDDRGQIELFDVSKAELMELVKETIVADDNKLDQITQRLLAASGIYAEFVNLMPTLVVAQVPMRDIAAQAVETVLASLKTANDDSSSDEALYDAVPLSEITSSIKSHKITGDAAMRLLSAGMTAAIYNHPYFSCNRPPSLRTLQGFEQKDLKVPLSLSLLFQGEIEKVMGSGRAPAATVDHIVSHVASVGADGTVTLHEQAESALLHALKIHYAPNHNLINKLQDVLVTAYAAFATVALEINAGKWVIGPGPVEVSKIVSAMVYGNGMAVTPSTDREPVTLLPEETRRVTVAFPDSYQVEFDIAFTGGVKAVGGFLGERVVSATIGTVTANGKTYTLTIQETTNAPPKHDTITLAH